MIVEKLWLRHFRNYENEEVSFNPHMNMITGNNAQGKTNLLESLVYLSLTRSHRISEDSKLVMKEKEMAKIGCELVEDNKTRLEIVLHPGGKTLFINKQPLQRSSEFIGKLNVVLFSPDDLSLFYDAPRTRRRILDQEITKINKKYLYALNHYRELLKERNILLKSNRVDETYLDSLEEQMIQDEIIIIDERKKFINQINVVIQVYYQELAQEKNVVQIKYECCVDFNKDLENELKNLYQWNRKKDIESHVTGIGIHREDIQFMMNENEVIHVASQGQKRMLVLAFKLSLLQYIEQNTNRKPILLLDDVLSELDKKRQKKLLEMIQKEYQCFITTTEKPEELEMNDYTEYVVTDGKIEMIGGLQ